MKRLMAMLLCVVMAIGAALAQDSKTITGIVVDQNGNPIAGAEVIAAGGGITAITDADGSFTMDVPVLLKKVIASYPGSYDETVSISDISRLVITLTQKKPLSGFLSFIGSAGFGSYEVENIRHNNHLAYGAGLMGGQLGNWGWYLKGMYNGIGSYSGGMMTAGATKQIGKSSSHVYLGAGLSSYDGYWGPAVDFGAIIKIGKNFNIITGLNYNQASGKTTKYSYKYDTQGHPHQFIDEDHFAFSSLNLNIGFGYVF